ncbi:hypothetical protein [Bradyrhizobium sp. 27S5]|uniref:hypothetical protein n=1 Tax=Bradyrhizobium sp. 27S5 TaxID=3139728 RepID=UPI0030D26280
MKPVLPILDPATADKDLVTILQKALVPLWGITPNPPIKKPTGAKLTAYNKEVDEQRYGDITNALVSDFQTFSTLPATGILTAETADSINKTLVGINNLWLVKGAVKVKKADGTFQPLPHLPVSLWTENGTDSPPEWGAATTSDKDGNYETLSEVVEKDGKPLPQDLFARVFTTLNLRENEAGRSTTVWNAFLTQSTASGLDVVVDEAKLPPVEYPWVLAEVQARMTRANIVISNDDWSKLARADITRLVTIGPDTQKVVVLSEQQIEHLVFSHIFASVTKHLDLSLDAEFFYAILRTEALLYASFGTDIEAKPTDAKAIRPDAQLLILPGRQVEEPDQRSRHLAQIAFYSTPVSNDGGNNSSLETELYNVIKKATDARVISAKHLGDKDR